MKWNAANIATFCISFYCSFSIRPSILNFFKISNWLKGSTHPYFDTLIQIEKAEVWVFFQNFFWKNFNFPKACPPFAFLIFWIGNGYYSSPLDLFGTVRLLWGNFDLEKGFSLFFFFPLEFFGTMRCEFFSEKIPWRFEVLLLFWASRAAPSYAVRGLFSTYCQLNYSTMILWTFPLFNSDYLENNCSRCGQWLCRFANIGNEFCPQKSSWTQKKLLFRKIYLLNFCWPQLLYF